MKNYIQKFICKGFILMAGASMVLTGCKESFLEPDPQTMFKPSEVFTTEDGIRSVLAICDRQLKRNYVSEDSREMMVRYLPAFWQIGSMAAQLKTAIQAEK